MIAELDRLSEKVELARATIVKLRDDNRRLLGQCEELRRELDRFRAVGETPEALLDRCQRVELLSLEREELVKERAEIAERVRGLLGKVETLEDLS
jgi:hypothetical protein